MKATVGIIPGDGIGREVVPAAVTVLEQIARRYGHQFNLLYGLLDGAAMDRGLPPMPPETLAMCRSCDAVLFGAGGDPKYDVKGSVTPPVKGHLAVRQEMELFTNIRPVKCLPVLANRTPLKPEILESVDLVIVRDFSGSMQRGQARSWGTSPSREAEDILTYSESEVTRALSFCFALARSRSRKLTVVCQASIYATSRLWKNLAGEMATDDRDIQVETMAPDNCAMQLMRNPRNFDVVVNDVVPMGGMLNNQAAMLMGSVGMGPSATVSPGSIRGTSANGSLLWGFGWYEPIHGSAPIHAGKDEANPVGTMLSLALMLRHSMGLDEEADAVNRAVARVLKTHRTYDIMEQGKTQVGTKEMGELVAAAV